MKTDHESLYGILIGELRDVAIFLTALDGRITTWNGGVELILGWPEGEFIGQSIDITFTPEDRELDIPRQEREAASVHGRVPDVRWHLRKDGSRVFVEGALLAVKDDAGRVTAFCKIMRDISPHRVVGNLLKTILEGTEELIIVKDREGRYTFANSAAARVLGRTIDDVLGRTDADLLDEDTRKAVAEVDHRVMTSGAPERLEEIIQTADGSVHTYLTVKAPWRSADHSVLGVVGIAQDITDRKRADEAREQLLKELQRSNVELAQFAHVVSHDLQAPIRMVKSFTELLAQRYRGALDETADEFIDTIQRGAGSMEQLVRTLLNYATVGQEPMAVEPVRLGAVVDDAVAILNPMVDEAGAQIVRVELPTVHGDRVLLGQLFQNLISNAIKYHKPAEPPTVSIQARERGQEWLISVADNGVGVDPANHELIFAPLKRLHGDEIAGTGIGLAVCKRIVERHGGRIWVESARGIGATFYFTIPHTAR